MHTLKNFYQRITNRGNHWSPMLMDLEGFTAYPSSSEATALRQFLKLDIGGTNYYARGLVAALVANYDLMVFTREKIKMTDIALALSLMPANTGLQSVDAGAKVIAGDSDPTGLIRLTTTWPVSHEIKLRRIDGNTASYECAGQTATVQAYLVGSVLRVAWPSETGLHAYVSLLDHASQWTTGSVINFVDEPESYPYAEMLLALEPHSYWLKLLNRFGIAAHYAGAVGQYVTRAGMLAAALILDTKA